MEKILRLCYFHERRTDHLTATDPRDMVYTLLVLATDAKSLNSSQNCSKPCSLVFTELAVAILRGDIYAYLRNRFPKNQDGVPSWVPEWTTSLPKTLDSDASYYMTDWTCFANPYSAAERSVSSADFPFSPGGKCVFSMSGIAVGQIYQIAPLFHRAALSRVNFPPSRL